MLQQKTQRWGSMTQSKQIFRGQSVPPTVWLIRRLLELVAMLSHVRQRL